MGYLRRLARTELSPERGNLLYEMYRFETLRGMPGRAKGRANVMVEILGSATTMVWGRYPEWKETWRMAEPFFKARGKSDKEILDWMNSIKVGKSTKIKKAAGYAHMSQDWKVRKILLHPILFDMNELGAYQNAQLKETFFHELAHHVVWFLWGMKCNPHGAEWWMAMSWFNFMPNRCHDMNTAQMASYHEREDAKRTDAVLDAF